MKKFLALMFAVVFAAPVLANSTGVWFDAEQDGHGISLFDIPAGKVFWWFTYHPEFGQTWLMSDVSDSGDFVVFRPLADQFPTAPNVSIGEPVGTVTLSPQDDGFLMEWDLFVEPFTCRDRWGPVPPGPLDPRCRDSEGRFDGNIVLRAGIDEQGSANLIRLTPAVQ